MAIQKGNLVYLHPPKTGGTFIKEYLCRYHKWQILETPDIHKPAHHYPGTEKMVTFREPLAWWLSVWKHLRDYGTKYMLDGHYQPKLAIQPFWTDDPVEFLKRVNRWLPTFYRELLESYQPNKAEILIRTEQITEALIALSIPDRKKRLLKFPVYGARPANIEIPEQLKIETREIHSTDWITKDTSPKNLKPRQEFK